MEAQVARVRAVRGAIAVVAVEMVAGHVGQAFDTFLHELLISRLERGVVLIVVLAQRGLEPGVGVASVLDEDDRGIGAGGAELLDERHTFLSDGRRVHVRKTVDHVGGGVDTREEIAYGLVHAAIAREAEVYDRHVKASSEDRRVHHAWAAGAGTVRDRGAVEDDRLRARFEADELFAFGHADVEEFYPVKERQVDRVFAFTGVESVGDAEFHLLRARADDLYPAPLAIFVAGVEVEAADAGGGHVRHRKLSLGHLVMRVDRRGVGTEAEHLAHAVAAQAPDCWSDLAVGFGGQAVEVALTLRVGEGAAFEVGLTDVMPGDLRVRGDGETVNRLRRGLSGRSFRGGLSLLSETGGSGTEQGEEEGGSLHGFLKSEGAAVRQRDGADCGERLLVFVERGDVVFAGLIRALERRFRGRLGLVEVRLGFRFHVFSGSE